MGRLRRLLEIARAVGAPRGAASPPPPPRPPPPAHPLALDAAGLRAHGGPCVDVRPAEALAAGIVEGALVLGREDATRMVALLPGDAVVLAGSDAEAIALAEALVAAGHARARASVGGITTWVAAGRRVREPAWKSPLPPGHAVALEPRAGHLGRGAVGLDPGASGWVQDVRWADDGFRFDVCVVSGGALARVDGLAEEDLRSLGPRGAAGLGTVV